MSQTHVKRVFLAALGMIFMTAAAWAKPYMAVTLSTAKEVTETKGGVKSTKLVPTRSAVAGDILHYTLAYTNKGDEQATSAVIDNPIPKGTSYVSNSAVGTDTEITFSNDGGKNYAPPVKLTYEVKLPNGEMERRITTPGDYTNIRWTIKSVAPGAGGTVGFKVHVK